MLSNLVSLLSNSITKTSAQKLSVKKTEPKSNNPFASSENSSLNPFLSTSFGTSANYGKNQPVLGGYFAGYYNGKPNIVGRKLFIEV